MIRESSFLVALVVVLSTSTTALAKLPQMASSPNAAGVHAAIIAKGSWTTYHHDGAHTGYDPAAPKVGSVAPTPGWTETALDAEVFAEPLIYNGLVYVATLNNTVYALNQTDGTPVWHINLGAPVTGGWSCGNVSPQGILGTPVIDATGGRIYVTTLFASDHTYRVFGLDLATGAIKLQTVIPATIGTGFDWTIHQQRGALAVANGYVYVPFGGRYGDCGSYHGWVVGVPIIGSGPLAVYETRDTGIGIWASGGVVVDDSTGNVFVATGNGVASGCNSVNQNDAIVRLSSSLVLQDYFMPQDWQANWCNNDQDLGSASPLLISPSLLFQSGKWGGGFLLNPNSLGGVDGQRFPTPKPAVYSQAEVCFGNHGAATFGSFAYAAPFIYVECEARGLVALNVNTSAPSFSPCDAACAAPNWHAGNGFTFGPPIVAGGAVWVASDGAGLYAFNAATGAQIYHSANFRINRFVTPAEAGGQVFVPSHTVIKSFSYAGGLMRVTTSPAVPSQITVDGNIADTWGLTWLELQPGSHTVCFSWVQGYITPACQTATVTSSATTTVTGTFVPRGFLHVVTSPAVQSTISVDGTPMDDWSVWTDIPTGSHQVCFGLVVNFTPPGCQTVTVNAGATTTVTGTFTSSPGAPGPTNFGFLRVTTSPALSSQITVDSNIADTWGLNWLKVAPGSHTVCFTWIEGYTTPACQTMTVTAGLTTTVTGTFIQRGFLRVQTSPVSPGTVFVNGIPRNNWGLWTDLPTGTYQVCFGVVLGFANTPGCQSAVVTAGSTSTITGTYS